MVGKLDRGLKRLALLIEKDLGLKIENIPGAGAAGGLGAGIMAFLGGKLESGVGLVLDTVDFSEKIADAQLVLTGEGKLDQQTIYGKVPLGVAKKAQKKGVPVVALGGWVEPEIKELRETGFTAFFSILDRPRELSEGMARAGELIEGCTEEIVRLFFAGRNFRSRRE